MERFAEAAIARGHPWIDDHNAPVAVGVEAFDHRGERIRFEADEVIVALGTYVSPPAPEVRHRATGAGR